MIVLAIAVALLVALAPGARADTPRHGGTFRVPVPEAPTHDPHQLIAQRRETDPARRREIVHAIQIIGQSRGSRLTHGRLER